MAYDEKKARETMLKGMNEIVLHLNNEDAITPWLIGGVPDGADDEEIEDMASDDAAFYGCARLFLSIMRKRTAYEDGLCIGKQVISAPKEPSTPEETAHNAEFECIKHFAEFAFAIELSSPLADIQLRALWTAYCFSHGLEVDTSEYDRRIRDLWRQIPRVEDSGRGSWKSFNEFDDFMCALIV